ncbi:MAG: hypothetical protein ACK41D_09475 [Rubricoccaceae bacterium]
MPSFLPRAKPAPYFPPAEGAYLDGRVVRFPEDLPAELNLLVVAFRDDLDPLADQWARLGATLGQRYQGRLAALELPVVGHRLKSLGELATLGIRAQVEGEAERARTVPIFVKKKAFRRALGTHDSSDVYVFLVRRSGKILWRTSGELAVGAVAELEETLASVLGTPGPAPAPAALSETEPPTAIPEERSGEDAAAADAPGAPQ